MKKLICLLLFTALFITCLQAQQVNITGKVTAAVDGTPLQGVTVAVNSSAGEKSAVITNPKGEYTIAVNSRAKELIFSYVGMQTVTERINNRTVINVTMSVQTGDLEQVVVTALGIKRETKALTYSQQGVDMNELNETKGTNIINSLSGKVAGLQVVPAGFNTGSARVVIRGNTSLTGNNQPLFVVDGMPIDNAAGDAGSLDYGNNAADINSEDVESIQVLKGPNAAALYGSRAANGVILITTKKGTNKFKVTLNSTVMSQKLVEFPEYQNAYGVGTSFYIDNTHRIPMASVNYRSWGSPMMGQPYVALNGETKPYLPHPNNVQDFYNSATLITNAVSVEGGNAMNVYRLGYTNYNGTSVVKGFNEAKKHNLEFRLQNNFASWITLDSKIGYIRDIVDNRQYSNANGRNPTNLYGHMARSTDLPELLPYKDEATGMEIGTHRNFSNPYWVINENPNKDVKDRVIATFSPEIKLTSWAKFTGRLGADIYWWDGYEFNNIGSVVASNPFGFMRTFNTKQQNFNVEGIFSLNKKLNDFSIVTNLGASSFSSDYERREERINSLLQPGLINLSNAREYPLVSQNMRSKQINSVFGSASFGYRNFAFIDVTGRNDWSSTLPASNNSYFYPSIGGTLILSDLLHMNNKIVSLAKLRASVAVVGNDTDPYRLDQTYSFNGFLNNAPLASLSTTMNNPDLKPERTSSYETGFDLRMFKNRLSLSGTYYNSSTTNQIITAQLPTSSGYQQRIYNAGRIDNWGYEAVASGKIVDGKKFKWESGINFSKNNSKVVELIEGIDRFQLNNNSSYIYVYAEVGKPYGNMRGLGVARDSIGRRLIEDGGNLLIKDNDREFGPSTPDWLAGFNNSFRYGKFDVGFLVDVRMGGMLYSGTYSRMLTNGVVAETLYGRDDYYMHSVIFGESSSELRGGAVWDAYYTNGNKNTKFSTPQNYEYARPNFAEFVMFDASFVKLREVTAGYTFDGKQLKKTPFKSARVSLAGRNLAIFHRNTPVGIDPEATSTSGNGQGIENGALPPNSIYGFNVRLSF